MPDDTPPPTGRKAISRRLRFEILRRDQHQCRYCGAQAPDVKLTVDHVIPVALGGSDDPSNLVAACRDCNAGKSSSSPDAAVVADVEDDAIRYARAMARAAEMRVNDRWVSEESIAYFKDSIWNDWGYEDRAGTRHHIPLPATWATSIQRFLELGFDLLDLTRYVRVAMESTATHQDKFRYMCGCLWRELEERQRLARELLESGAV